MELKFAKIVSGAKIPVKREEDACFDLWSAGGEDIVLPPHQVVKVGTGIASAFDPEWVAIIKERSGNGSKGIAVKGGVLDSGYRGEWIVCLMNVTDEEIVLPKEKAVAQVMILPVPKCNIVETDYDILKNIKSERGVGGFGSTDQKG